MSLAALALVAAPACADSVAVATFERGLPAGWTATAGGWTVGGTTGTQPNITPPEDSAFARCGAPNVVAGPRAESRTGTLTSPPLVVTCPTLSWVACGLRSENGNGVSRFEILNARRQVIATIAAPLTDAWTPQSVNLLAAGQADGDTFTFRAIDGLALNNTPGSRSTPSRSCSARGQPDASGQSMHDGPQRVSASASSSRTFA